MIDHYNAFISYRHHPDDIRVASEIHRSLERFHVPRSIRKKHGQIKRLFRDKEELPITSSLSDDIGYALKNSDFLIVICSVHTKESVWVQREIELFLKSHDRSKVLTVLASGEPYDVIPDILLFEDVKDPVTGKVTRKEYEPLSCDWRLKHRKALQEELPRLAAPLLGCSYDELRQRQKQYRTRRNMTIVSASLAASLCLTAYFLHTSITIQKANVQIQAQNEEIHAQNVEIHKQNEEIKAANIQIQANLDASLVNQSRHLATAALEHLADGDRLTAISLAMAALPSEHNTRPYVPEAEYVLSAALGVYNTSNTMEAVGTLTPGVNILVNNFWVSDSETTLYLEDNRNIITCWDAATLQKAGEISLTEKLHDGILPLKNDDLLILGGMGINTVSCFRPDGTPVWERQNCLSTAYLAEENILALLEEKQGEPVKLLFVDAATGEPVKESYTLPATEDGYTPVDFLTTANEESGFAVLCYYQSLGSPYLYCALDLRTGQVQPIVLDVYPMLTEITRDGKLIIIGDEDGLGMAGIMEGNRVTTPGTRQIFCYDLHTGVPLWNTSITASVGGSSYGVFEIPGRDYLLFICGNIFMTVDSQTGETIASCGAGSGIINLSVGDQVATAVLQDGYMCNYNYDSNYCYETKCMKNGVSYAHVGNNCYSLHWQADHVTVYRNIAGTPAWEAPIDGGFSVKNQKSWGHLLAFQDLSRLYLFDIREKTMLWTAESGTNNILGFSADGKTLWYGDARKSVTALEIATGSCDTVEIPIDGGEYAEIRGTPSFIDGCLYYVIGGIAQPKLVIWELSTGQKTDCPLQVDTEEDYRHWSWDILQAGERYLWLWRSGYMLLEVDLQTGISLCIPLETSQRPTIALSADEKTAAIGIGEELYLKTSGEEEMTQIPLENAGVGSLCIRNDTLFALCSNGFIYRYDLSGQLLSQTELEVPSSFGSSILSPYKDSSALSWHFTEGNRLILNALSTANVIDCESWSVTAAIPNFIMYEVEENALLCKLGGSIVAFTHLDTGSLLEKAEEALNGFCLTEAQKTAYGID